jgi:MoaA/NifB/PqqE/SkfB family radical SAM enzyme
METSGSDSVFCVHPWIHLRLQADGEGRVCCRYLESISNGGAPLSLRTHTFDEIWNADEMRAIRRDMIEGRRVAACAECYDEDARGVISMRVRDNTSWANGWLNDERLSIDELKSRVVDAGFRMPAMPVNIEVDTGNLCNLKCRMCHDGVSSRIGTDLVHRSWATDQYEHAYHDANIVARPGGVRRWNLQEELEAAIVRAPDEVKRIYFVGGEPLLVKEIGTLLERLIELGVAPNIILAIVSNGTVTGSWLHLTRHFKRLDLSISIDGFQDCYDYIRYPARWERLVEHLKAFRELPNVLLGGAVTLQAYNALSITDLFRYLDSLDLGFYAWPVHVPRYLSVDVMPPAARDVAAQRLRTYADTDCRPRSRDLVRGLADYVAPKSDGVDPGLLRDFMLFTNDLDVSRGQSFAAVEPELLQFLEREGFPWTSETLHARAVLRR